MLFSRRNTATDTCCVLYFLQYYFVRPVRRDEALFRLHESSETWTGPRVTVYYISGS